jgi:hypothetical protein
VRELCGATRNPTGARCSLSCFTELGEMSGWQNAGNRRREDSYDTHVYRDSEVQNSAQHTQLFVGRRRSTRREHTPRARRAATTHLLVARLRRAPLRLMLPKDGRAQARLAGARSSERMVRGRRVRAGLMSHQSRQPASCNAPVPARGGGAALARLAARSHRTAPRLPPSVCALRACARPAQREGAPSALPSRA